MAARSRFLPALARWSLPALLSLCVSASPARSADGTLVGCRDFRTGLDLEVYAERVTAAGEVHAGWTPDSARLCAGTAQEYSYRLASDGAGGALIAWVESGADGSDLYAQHLTASGEVAPGWPAQGLALCLAPRDQYSPRLVADGTGGAWIIWQDYRSGRGAIYASHLSGGGQRPPGWPSDGVAVCSAAAEQSGAVAVSDGTGGAIVVWQEMGGDSCRLRAQRLNPAGERGWNSAGIAVATSGFAQVRPAAVSDGSGGALIAWEESRSGAPHLYAMRLTGQGARAAGWPAAGVALCSAAGAQRFAVLAPDGSGGALVAWFDTRAGSGDLYAQHVTANGTLAAGWAEAGVAVCAAGDEQYDPAILADGSGGAFVAWTDYRSGGDGDIYAARVTAGGSLAPGWPALGVPLCTTTDLQTEPTLSPDGAGGAIATWSDARSAGTATFQARSGPVGPGPSLISAEANAERARLEWQAAAGASIAPTLMRSSEGEEWRSLAALTPDARGVLFYEDRSVTPGKYYHYRLALARGSELELLAEVTLEIPRAVAFALLGSRPSPARGSLRVAFALPSSAPARLELLDIGGRRVAVREVGTLGPGDHLVELGAEGSLAPGVYILRLSQGRRTSTVRAAVIR